MRGRWRYPQSEARCARSVLVPCGEAVAFLQAGTHKLIGPDRRVDAGGERLRGHLYCAVKVAISPNFDGVAPMNEESAVIIATLQRHEASIQAMRALAFALIPCD